MQKLFCVNFDGDEVLDIQEVLDSYPTFDDIAQSIEVEDFNSQLASQLVTGVLTSIDEISKQIEEFAPQWPTAQIQKVDKEILSVAIWEAFIAKITPPKVAIDEAIEIAKEFGGDTSSKFVNGVLGAIYEQNDQNN